MGDQRAAQRLDLFSGLTSEPFRIRSNTFA